MEKSTNKTTMLICGCLAVIFLLGSYIAALAQFGNPIEYKSDETSVIEESSEEESSEVSIESVAESEYKYFDKLQFENNKYKRQYQEW